MTAVGNATSPPVPEPLIITHPLRAPVTHAGLFGIPEWLFVGLGIGIGVSVLAAGVFAVADRRYPSRAASRHGHGGDTRRRAELRDYLDAIGESYAEDHPVEGQAVAFYLPEHDVAITFDARAFYRIERADTHAVLVEHEMPGAQLGQRLPFETPDIGFGADRDGAGDEYGPTGYGVAGRDPAAAAFAELGVSAGATVEEVKSAYRRRVKETHPDQGGDEDEFKRVREAYTTAKKHAG